jgi:hypothetical protein
VADPGVKMECCGGKGVLGWTADLRERMQGRKGFFFSSSFFLLVEPFGPG